MGGVGSPAPGAPVGDVETTIELPVSFDKVWFRPGRDSGLGKGKQSGLLTVSESGLEFSAKNQSHVLPWSRIEMISYGRMSGDTDTKWVVLSLNRVAGQWGVIGYRDGQKFGYGGETTRIFDAIAEGLRRAGSGPFAVPEGSSPFVNPFLQFALALPDGWHAFEASQTFLDGRPLWGRTIFSPLDLTRLRGSEEESRKALAAIRAGSERAIFLDRFESTGLSCGRLGKAGRRTLREEINAELRPMQLVSELDWVEHPHRYCTAWSANGRARRGDTEIGISFYAVSDDRTAYVFTTFVPAGTEMDASFEPLSRSLKTAVAD
jgi:hypothetical protein